jgi:ribosomal-protein-alanine N-acetyltransferase
VSIRAAKADDVLVVDRIEQTHRRSPRFPHHYLDELENPLSRFFVSCLPETGAVIGFIIYWVIDTTMEIHQIAVEPAFQRRGVGKSLMDFSIKQAASEGVKKIFLEVRESNMLARQFYAGCNFVEHGRRKEYYRHPREDALIYCRDLG